MREIKFRVWDKFSKRVIYPEEHIKDDVMVIRCLSGKVGYEWGSEGGGGVEDDENLIPMQYTGLKDKNGKEIYEGDICRVNQSEEPFEVVFAGIGFWFKRDDGELFVFMPKSYWIEVIGNIYENPELLKEKP